MTAPPPDEGRRFRNLSAGVLMLLACLAIALPIIIVLICCFGVPLLGAVTPDPIIIPTSAP